MSYALRISYFGTRGVKSPVPKLVYAGENVSDALVKQALTIAELIDQENVTLAGSIGFKVSGWLPLGGAVAVSIVSDTDPNPHFAPLLGGEVLALEKLFAAQRALEQAKIATSELTAADVVSALTAQKRYQAVQAGIMTWEEAFPETARDS